MSQCTVGAAVVRGSFADIAGAELLCAYRVLLTAYSSYLQPSWFTEEAYLWAVELWYAYAIQVCLYV